jgi:capsular exopolysaccharide synthesis family protein
VASQPEIPELDPQESNPRSGLSLLQIMWQRKSLVILGIMLGLVLGLLYYAQRPPVYQSTAQILVVKKSGTDSSMELSGRNDNRTAYMEDYMSTQSVLIRSPEIINRAIKLPQMQELKTFPTETGLELVYGIREQMMVARDTKEGVGGAPTNILTVSFKGGVSEECPKIVECVISSYQGFLNETYKNVSEKTLELINQARDTLMTRVETQQQAYQEFRTKNPFLHWRGQNGTTGGNIHSERLTAIERRRALLKIEMQEKTDQLLRVEKALKENGPHAAMLAIQAIGLDPKLFKGEQNRDVEVQLLQLKLKRQQLLSTLGENHPAVKELDQTIELLLQIYGRPGGVAAESKPAAKALRDPNDPLSYISALKEEVADITTRVEALNNMFDTEAKTAREMNVYELEEERLSNNLKQSRELLNGIVKRLSELSLVKDFGGYEAKSIAPPGLGRKVSPNPLTVFPLSGIGGLVAGLCLAYLAELSDKSFRTPAEIRRRLGLPVIGHIPYYAADEKAAKQLAAGEPIIDPMLCTHYQSNSVSSEAYRSVRTALYFNTHGVGHQVIQVTSPNVSDGKSTLAANLAVSIAQSGKRTIIIDGDCRRPRLHKIFNVPADSGLASVIAGQTDLASAIRPSSVPNLSILPCGPRPANPAELLTSPRFKELLDIIRSQYDFVIIDTPPLLVVTDPCVVAPRVDGVILAIRVTKNGRPFAERAKEILASLGANVLGVVVNGLGSPSGGKYGYGYDQYQYGYGYTYRYSYTYTDEYSDDKAASYYNTEPAGQAPPADKLEQK